MALKLGGCGMGDVGGSEMGMSGGTPAHSLADPNCPPHPNSPSAQVVPGFVPEPVLTPEGLQAQWAEDLRADLQALACSLAAGPGSGVCCVCVCIPDLQALPPWSWALRTCAFTSGCPHSNPPRTGLSLAELGTGELRALAEAGRRVGLDFDTVLRRAATPQVMLQLVSPQAALDHVHSHASMLAHKHAFHVSTSYMRVARMQAWISQASVQAARHVGNQGAACAVCRWLHVS